MHVTYWLKKGGGGTRVAESAGALLAVWEASTRSTPRGTSLRNYPGSCFQRVPKRANGPAQEPLIHEELFVARWLRWAIQKGLIAQRALIQIQPQQRRDVDEISRTGTTPRPPPPYESQGTRNRCPGSING